MWAIGSICVALVCINDVPATSIDTRQFYISHKDCVESLIDQQKDKVWFNPDYIQMCIYINENDTIRKW